MDYDEVYQVLSKHIPGVEMSKLTAREKVKKGSEMTD